jgi:hypothetical protein
MGSAGAENYSGIENIASQLTEHENVLRDRIMNEIITTGVSLDSSSVERLNRHGDLDLKDTLTRLESKYVLSRDKKGNIAYVYPVSAHPTQHKVSLQDGRVFHAMCAIDSLGCAFTFEQDVSIQSSCSYCDAPISVAIGNGKLRSHLPSELRVLRYNLNTIESIHVDR